MSISTTLSWEVEYPESDGRPMGETELHQWWMIRILDLLRFRYRGQRVYTASNLLVYFEEGNPHRFVVPDNFVVLNCEPGMRRVFKTWEEKRVPDVVFEVTSRSTRREDETFKPAIYEQIGVQEYFLYDATGEYLSPALRGFRRQQGGGFVSVQADADGRLLCETLGIWLLQQGSELVLLDRGTGQVLLTEAESERAALSAAESRIAALESEIERLKRQVPNPPQ